MRSRASLINEEKITESCSSYSDYILNQFILIIMFKSILLIALACSISLGELVKVIDQCPCDKIKTAKECSARQTCEWKQPATANNGTGGAGNSTVGSCETKPGTAPATDVEQCFCSSFAEGGKCAKTAGCAWIDNKCTYFTGCSAYSKASNQDCQSISYRCISDGQQCVEATICSEYVSELACKNNPSLSGTLKCVWDNSACRDYFCTEADKSFNTDLACSAWLKGCVTNGKGCVQARQICSSYTGDDVACAGLIGTDGKCEGQAGGANCRAKLCTGAPSSTSTNEACSEYQLGCITSGKGCIVAPLPACSTFTVDNNSCVGYIGSDGPCEGDAGATSCRARVCTNAPVTTNTDSLCSTYKLGCVTTGKGCATSRGACSTYSGTISSCDGFIGTDGYCKGTNANLNSPCAAKACTEAPSSSNTDAICAKFQIGCKTNGKGCVATLGPCSSYSGTTVTCEGFIGSDGKCKGNSSSTSGPCTSKLCKDAPASITTNEACAQYQTGCVTNGAGCVNLIGCLDTVKESSCLGTPSCTWNMVCVASQFCSDFLTISICLGNQASRNVGSSTILTPCFWTGSQCRDLACTDAPSSLDTDALCNSFLTGCLTNKNGCFAPTAPCSEYKGTKAICSAFTKKCWNSDSAGPTSPCQERQCADDITSTTDTACDSFKARCRTKGVGCIDPSLLCSSYVGTQSQCGAFKGINGTITCWNVASATATSPCTVKQCANNTVATSDGECESFLTGCLTTGAGCIEKAAACSSYTGAQAQCGNFKGDNGTTVCWSTLLNGTGPCANKTCSHAPTSYSSDGECSQFLSGCVTNGAGCISSTAPCSQYTGTLVQCSDFTGNNKRCYNQDACAERACSDKASAFDNAECVAYLSTCRFFNGTCVNGGTCASYAGTSVAMCQDVLNLTNQKCWWVSGSNCTDRFCTNAPSVTSQDGCNQFVAGCRFDGNTCVNAGSCSSYIAFGSDSSSKLNNCKEMTNSANPPLKCWYSAGANCVDRMCTNVPSPTSQASCDTHVSQCWFNGTACLAAGSCSSYSVSRANDAAKLAICSAMKDNSSQQCWYTSGQGTCASRTCADVIAAAGQQSCTAHLNGCKWIGNACVPNGTCASYVPTPANGSLVEKLAICNSLTGTSISVPVVPCTYVSGSLTCVTKTCETLLTATSQADCTTWMANCQWNGRGCEEKKICDQHVVFVAADNDRNQLCGNLTTPADEKCTFASTASAGNYGIRCESRTCAGKIAPTQASDCTSWMATCRFVGSSLCVDASLTCAYTPTGVDNAAKKVVCENINNGASPNPTRCTYTNDVPTCRLMTCVDIASAVNQGDCNSQVPGCLFRSNNSCVTPHSECAYTPVGNTNAEKKTHCETLTTQIGGGSKCSYGDGAASCHVKQCSDIVTAANQADCTAGLAGCFYKASNVCYPVNSSCAYTPSPGTNAEKKVNCATFKNATTNPITCGYTDDEQFCRLALCTDIATAANQAACNTAATSLGLTCLYRTTNSCVAYSDTCAYTAVGATSADKKTHCETLTTAATNGSKCTYQSGATCKVAACSDITVAVDQQACTTAATALGLNCLFNNTNSCIPYDANCAYVPIGGNNTDKKINCEMLKSADTNGRSCTYSNDAPTCRLLTCGEISTAANQAACDSQVTGCMFRTTNSCVSYLSTCFYYTVGSTNTERKTDCESFKTASNGINCTYSNDWTTCRPKECTDITAAANQNDCNTQLPSSCVYAGTNSCIQYVAGCFYMPIGATDNDKRTYCAALVSAAVGGQSCQFLAGDFSCSVRTCAGKTDPADQNSCTSWKAGCKFISSSTACVDASSTCTYNTNGNNHTTKRTNCELLDNGATPPLGCSYVDGASTCSLRTCNQKTNAASDADCSNWLSTCKWVGGTSACVEVNNTCNYTINEALSGADIATRCQTLTSSAANPACQQWTGRKCVAKDCTNIQPAPTSHNNCVEWKSSCRYTGSACVSAVSDCAYTLSGSVQSGTNDAKREHCKQLTTSAGLGCTFVDGAAACSARNCGAVHPAATNDAECKNWLGTCAWNGAQCISADICSNYTATGADDSAKGNFCRALKNNSTPPVLCGFTQGSTNCVNRSCSNAPTPNSASDCSTYLPGCTITNSVPAACITSTSPCSSFTGLPQQCQSFTGNSLPCWSAPNAPLNTAAPCQNKACTHNTTSKTNEECSAFMSGCKTNGAGCVAGNSECSLMTGNATTCVKYKASDNVNFCKVGAGTSDACTDKTCQDAGDLSTDSACNSFLTGCVTTGFGCIPSSEPCSKYVGTRATCSAFTGNGKKCWNAASATATTPCVEKKCSDDAVSNTDAACASSLAGCVTYGTGCIEAAAGCGSYVGTQTSCANYKGNHGTRPCWNTANASATTACVNKTCNHNTTAKTDAECETFFPKPPGSANPVCVTNGAGCVDYPRACALFFGTHEQCEKFTASDGPCKSSSSQHAGLCTPRLCNEALNTNNTDALCKAYHPTCVTNGYGCVNAISCSNIQDKNSCSAKQGCSWVNNCRAINIDCPSLTVHGASICVNTPVSSGSKKCAWFNNACRAQNCEDLPATLTSHDSCKNISSSCTTKGSGCITIGLCASYSSESICKAAKTTQAGDTCIWENNGCRAKRCSDAPSGTTTDKACDAFLSSCKADGMKCINQDYTCSQLKTAAFCCKDSQGNTCLWVQGQCYLFTKCEDIQSSSHAECQKFSNKCTTDGQRCVAISTCAKTVAQASCIIGTDGSCGWLPAQNGQQAKCQKFTACSDAVSTDSTVCKQYGKNCITDGVKCVDVGDCSSYMTQIACEAGGKDGTCQFLASTKICRRRECSDATIENAGPGINTHGGCVAFDAKSKCTTDGTSCIAVSTCSSYTIEVSCTIGTDGQCIWSILGGAADPNSPKQCRVKACEDIKNASSNACALEMEGCVSNGVNCVPKGKCASYTSKEACNAGGTDGLCAFSPAQSSPSTGVCKLMTQCQDAIQDSQACLAKSAFCTWKTNTQGASVVTSCDPHNCLTKAIGTDCKPIPSFDSSSFTICVPSSTGCMEGGGSTLNQESCQEDSAGTYAWNPTNNNCSACFTQNPPISNNVGPSTGTTSLGGLLKILVVSVAMILLQ